MADVAKLSAALARAGVRVAGACTISPRADTAVDVTFRAEVVLDFADVAFAGIALQRA
jgi:hypothetical protein